MSVRNQALSNSAYFPHIQLQSKNQNTRRHCNYNACGFSVQITYINLRESAKSGLSQISQTFRKPKFFSTVTRIRAGSMHDSTEFDSAVTLLLPCCYLIVIVTATATVTAAYINYSI